MSVTPERTPRHDLTLSPDIPINISMLKAIGTRREDEIPQVMREICRPYRRTDALAPIDPKKIAGCIDDRRRAAVVTRTGSQGDISIAGELERYSLIPIATDEMARRTEVPARPWPGGKFGVDILTAYASITSGMMQMESFWSETDPELFTAQMMSWITMESEQLLGDLPALPIHIDNHHGETPIFSPAGWDVSVNNANVELLLAKGRGCGFQMVQMQVLTTMLEATGYEEIAADLRQKLVFEESGKMNPELAQLVASTSYAAALRSGSEVEIFVGPHNPVGTVISLGDRTPNRSWIAASYGPVESGMFKCDLGTLQQPDSLAANIIARIQRKYGDSSIEPMKTVAIMDLATLEALGQANGQRLYVE